MTLIKCTKLLPHYAFNAVLLKWALRIILLHMVSTATIGLLRARSSLYLIPALPQALNMSITIYPSHRSHLNCNYSHRTSTLSHSSHRCLPPYCSSHCLLCSRRSRLAPPLISRHQPPRTLFPAEFSVSVNPRPHRSHHSHPLHL